MNTYATRLRQPSRLIRRPFVPLMPESRCGCRECRAVRRYVTHLKVERWGAA